MRSRLDEIVEEECIKGYDGTVAKRIAERAFRHGAERHALWVKSVGDAAANVVPQMAPAPAEEKEWTQADSAAFWRRQCAPDSPFWGYFWKPRDRRQGERRKGQELVSGASKTFNVTSLSFPWSWQTDRRSGLDRRKP